MPRRGGGSVTVHIQGLDELRRRLGDLPEEIKEALRKAVKDAALEVKNDTLRQVPIRSGNLLNSVDIRYEDGGMKAKVGWFDQKDYYANYVEFGTRRTRAQPSLGPASELERRRYVERITEAVRRHLA